MKHALAILICYTTIMWAAHAQVVSISEAIELALQHSPYLKAADLDVERHQKLKRSASEIPRTEVDLLYGQYNSVNKNDNNISISQTLPFPTSINRQVQYSKSILASSEFQREMARHELIFEVKKTFYQLLFLKERYALLQEQDSIMSSLARAATLRYNTGEGSLLEKTAAETQMGEMKNLLQQNTSDQQVVLSRLSTLIDHHIDDITGKLEELNYDLTDSAEIELNPAWRYSQQQVQVAGSWRKLQQSKLLPDIKIGYFNQTLIGYQLADGVETYYGPEKRFQGIQFGLAIPLWFVPYVANTEAAKLSGQIAEKKNEQEELRLTGQWLQANQEFIKAKKSLAFYKEQALPNALLLSRQNLLAYQAGEITYTAFLLNAQNALRIREGHLEALHSYNQSVIYLEYLSGNIK